MMHRQFEFPSGPDSVPPADAPLWFWLIFLGPYALGLLWALWRVALFVWRRQRPDMDFTNLTEYGDEEAQ